MNQIIKLTVVELMDRVKHHGLTLPEIAEAYIQRIEEHNPRLNALVQFNAQEVRAQAQALQSKLHANEKLPLAGACFVVKDTINVKGQHISQGSLLFKDFVATDDALSVAKLKNHGALFLGIANTSEFACKGITSNLLYGETLNPCDERSTPGGSSGGCASAVAARFCGFALATDAGGSTRRPASHTGVVGFKPSSGLIAHPWAAAEPNFGNSVIGLMTHCVKDLKTLLPFLEGDHIDDIESEPSARFHFDENLKVDALRVAISPHLGLNFAVDDEVATCFEATVENIKPAFSVVSQVDPVWSASVSEELLLRLQFAGLAHLYGERWKAKPELFDPVIGQQIENGLALSGAEIAEALYVRQNVTLVLRQFFSQWDILLTPTTPVAAWAKDQLGPSHINGKSVGSRSHAVFTPLFNHALLPACSIPMGLSNKGLPLGLQVVGRRYEDYALLETCAVIEKLIGKGSVPVF